MIKEFTEPLNSTELDIKKYRRITVSGISYDEARDALFNKTDRIKEELNKYPDAKIFWRVRFSIHKESKMMYVAECRLKTEPELSEDFFK